MSQGRYSSVLRGEGGMGQGGYRSVLRGGDGVNQEQSGVRW